MTTKNRATTPSYLVRQPHSYCFRMVVPPRHRLKLGRAELKYTLHTGSLSTAKFRSRTIASFVLELFKKLAAGGTSTVQTLPPEQIQGLIRDFVADCLKTQEAATLGHTISEAVWFAELDHLQMTKAEEGEELARRDFSRVSHIADRVLSAAGITLAPSSHDFHRLCAELLKASKLLSEVWIARHQGDYGRTNAQVVAEAVAKVDVPLSAQVEVAEIAPPPASQAPQEKNLLTKVINEYSTEKKNAGKWRTKTEQENLACYRLFLAWAGQSIMVEDITTKHMRDYRAALQKLPANMQKSPEFRDKTVHELLALADKGQIKEPMDVTTINKYLNRMASLLKYAKKLKLISDNPAEDMQVEQPKRDEEQRDPFPKEDLHALFHSPQYTLDTFKHPYQFWSPLLALFTAARQNELAQLYLDDLRQEDGVWVFDINGKLDKKLKTKNAARLVPVHPFLLELGLVRYAQELQATGEARLFPEITKRRDGYGADVSRWFNGNGTSPGYRHRCGVDAAPDEPGKVFHSFRHTLIDLLVSKRVDSELIHRLDGHKLNSMTLDRYSKGRSLVRPMLEEVMSVVDFHKTIPLDHLKASKFARVNE